jgi:non-ribosomal peptide synthetase component E (peptide arylation enzyme)
VLFAHPKIADVAVIGLPDAASGERACAVVVTKGDSPITLDQMKEHLVGARLSMHKVPEQLEFVDLLPRNPTGKVLKKDLRVQFGGTQ